MANPCLTGDPILWSHVWDAVIMIPFFTCVTLYHFAGMCVYLPTQTVHSHCDPTTDTLPFHPWGSVVLREKLHSSCLKIFLKDVASSASDRNISDGDLHPDTTLCY